MDLVLFGIQGSGKGTQGRYLASRYDLHIFETGAQLRSLANGESELGQKVKSIIEAGNLVPNEVVMEIIEDFMTKIPEGANVLFDGIPRSSEQAETFNALMKKLGREFKGINITLTKEEALDRLSNRRICEKCKKAFPGTYDAEQCDKCEGKLVKRADDNEDAIKKRLEAFEQETMPVINAYKEDGNMIDINGAQEISEVSGAIMKVVEQYYS